MLQECVVNAAVNDAEQKFDLWLSGPLMHSDILEEVLLREELPLKYAQKIINHTDNQDVDVIARLIAYACAVKMSPTEFESLLTKIKMILSAPQFDINRGTIDTYRFNWHFQYRPSTNFFVKMEGPVPRLYYVCMQSMEFGTEELLNEQRFQVLDLLLKANPDLSLMFSERVWNEIILAGQSHVFGTPFPFPANTPYTPQRTFWILLWSHFYEHVIIDPREIGTSEPTYVELLHDIVRRHDAKTLEGLKFPSEEKDIFGKTALHRAAEIADVMAVEVLIQAGADVLVADHNHRLPLDCVRHKMALRERYVQMKEDVIENMDELLQKPYEQVVAILETAMEKQLQVKLRSQVG